MYQKVTIVGNLGRDPELRYLPNGTPTVTLSVATNNTYTNQKGEQVKETTWWRVSVFGKQAEACSQYLTKGRQVLVEGRLRPDPTSGGPRIYTRQDGTSGASFDLTAQSVRFIGGQREGGAPAPDMGGHEMPEEDIPFE